MPEQPSRQPGTQSEASAPQQRPRKERPSLTERSRHIGERIIEMGIFSIATLSILFIFLILFFIFREASPIFFGSDSKKEQPATVLDDYRLPGDTAGTAQTTGSDTMEQYGSTPDIPLGPKLAEENTTTDTNGTSPASGDDMEVYNAESDSIPLAGIPPGGPAGDSGAAAPAISATEQKRLDDSVARTIIGEDYPILSHDSQVKMSYLAHDNWQPNSEHPRYGIYPIIIGTLKTTLIALLFATPIAILAALYTAFFAPKRLREILKPFIELLAGFPSVVLGFFCLMTVASIVQAVFGVEYRLNAVVGGIGLGLAVIPIIYTITDDALRAVPKSLREAALAIGASEWQAAYQVMLPAATPGIFAAVLLGLGRAFGETMIALMATGNAGTFNWNFFEPVRTFAATIGAEMGEVVFGSPHYQILFLLGVILFVFSFLINLVTEFYVKQRLIKRFRGAE